MSNFSVLFMARALALPEPVCAALEEIGARMPWETLAPQIEALGDPKTANEARRALAEALGALEGDSGLGQLAAHLAAADRTRAKYRAAGVRETVFWDTMRCFPRFLEETHARTGRWQFDRAFWTWRQTACVLFRLGALEFEYCAARLPAPPGLCAGEPVLSVHIPSDASLSEEALDASYREMRRFFAEEGAAFCTQGAPRAVVCRSWLLAPALSGLLPADSGIRRFAADFTLYAVDESDTEFYQWLFGGEQTPEALPEKTSLQRAAKRFLAAGGRIGAAAGTAPARLAPGAGASNEKEAGV